MRTFSDTSMSRFTTRNNKQEEVSLFLIQVCEQSSKHRTNIAGRAAIADLVDLGSSSMILSTSLTSIGGASVNHNSSGRVR